VKKKKTLLKGILGKVIYLIFSVVLYPGFDDSVSAQDEVVIGRWVVEYGWVVSPLKHVYKLPILSIHLHINIETTYPL
jgi:hypothetical protein